MRGRRRAAPVAGRADTGRPSRLMGVHQEEFRRRARWMLLLRMLLGGVIITVLTGGAVATAGLMELKGITSDLQQTPAAELRPDTVTKAASGKPQTILLVGSDRRYGA